MHLWRFPPCITETSCLLSSNSSFPLLLSPRVPVSILLLLLWVWLLYILSWTIYFIGSCPWKAFCIIYIHIIFFRKKKNKRCKLSITSLKVGCIYCVLGRFVHKTSLNLLQKTCCFLLPNQHSHVESFYQITSNMDCRYLRRNHVTAILLFKSNRS